MTRKSSLGALPGRSRGTFSRSARDSLKDSPQVGAKMGARWAKLGPSWQLVGTSWVMMAPSWRSWAQLGRFWEHVGSILGLFWHMGWIAENLRKRLEKICFFWYFGMLEEVAEALFWRCWLQDGIFRASCKHLWDMLAPRRPTRRARWPT